jgi:hypothetical protein
MSARVRKLFGGAGLLVFLVGYVWAATAIADHLPDNGAVRLAFFGVVGIAWGVPILPLISWMNRGR